MREYVEAVYGPWDDAQQEGFHRAWFDAERVEIIEVRGHPIGVLDCRDDGDVLYLSRIELLPEHQGHGVGSAIITELTERGPVRLHVLVSNPRARTLYERLGFVATGTEDGRTAMAHPGPAS